MAAPVFILGGAQSDFSRNWTREGLGFFDLLKAVTEEALAETRLSAADIDVVHIGNFAGELFCGQGLLGGWMGHVDPGFEGKPTSRHEAACASGSMAILAAMSDLQAGHYDLACVAGIEMMRNVDGQAAADNLGAAAWRGREALEARYVWPAMFSDLAEEYDRRYGLKREHLGAISRKNFSNAKLNPNAQTRRWTHADASFSADDEANPVIEGWMRKSDCGQVTDGAAVIVLANEKRATQYAAQHGLSLEAIPRIKGWGHTTAPMLLADKFAVRRDGGYLFPWVRKAITDAYHRAGIAGPEAVDAFETHDCFSITEYMAIEHFGLTAPGEAWKAVESGRVDAGGDSPFNLSGGLIGQGHPVGATGVRMALDAWRQTSNRAGAMQRDGARTVATYNVGGSGTANAAFVFGI